MPHDLEKVFVHGRILAPYFGEGIHLWTNTCLMFLFLRGYSSVADEYIAVTQANTRRETRLFICVPAPDEKRKVNSLYYQYEILRSR